MSILPEDKNSPAPAQQEVSGSPKGADLFIIRTDHVSAAFGLVDYFRGTLDQSKEEARRLAKAWGRDVVYLERDRTRKTVPVAADPGYVTAEIYAKIHPDFPKCSHGYNRGWCPNFHCDGPALAVLAEAARRPQ